MSNNPWDYDDPVRKMMREMDRIRQMADPYSDIARQMKRDSEWMKQTDVVDEIKRQLENKYETQRYMDEREIMRALEERREITRYLGGRHDVQQQIAEALNPSLVYGEAIQSAASIGDIFSNHRRLIDGYVFDTFYGGGTTSLASTGSTSFQRANTKLVEKYEEVSESIDSEKEANLPPSARPMPTVEVFTSAEVVEELGAVPAKENAEPESEGESEDREERRQLRQELQQDGQIQLKPALEMLDPGLVKIWEGGGLTLSGDNPDRVRHFSASRRELMTHVLHLLAPDEEIRKWNDDPKFYHDGRPTRRARLHYICRMINQEPFQEFVKIDFQVMLETLDLFQQGTHALEPKFTPEQLASLNTRADQHLLFLLLIGNWRN